MQNVYLKKEDDRSRWCCKLCKENECEVVVHPMENEDFGLVIFYCKKHDDKKDVTNFITLIALSISLDRESTESQGE